jgi:hypothetical protein
VFCVAFATDLSNRVYICTVQYRICVVIVSNWFVYTIHKHEDQSEMQNYKKAWVVIVVFHSEEILKLCLTFLFLGLASVVDIHHNTGYLNCLS